MKKLPFRALTAFAFAVSASLPALSATYDVYPGGGAAGLQDALEEVALSGEPGEVVVHPGEYAIRDSLSIWPETTLTLEDGVVLKAVQGFDGAMLVGRHWSVEPINNATSIQPGTTCPEVNCKHGGYSQCHDVVVQGGTWDRNSAPTDNSAILVFRHSSGIVVRDLTAKNCSNHYFNFSGSEDVLVDGVAFLDAVNYQGSDPDFWLKYKKGDKTRYQTIEAIHLDFMDEAGEAGSYPLDGTPCRDILISNCLFDSVFAGAGTHHYASKAPATNVRIENCDFRNLFSYAVYCFGFEQMAVSGNSVSGGRGLIDCKGASCVVEDNAVGGASLYGVFATEKANVVLKRNTFCKAAGIAVCVRDGAVLDARDNVFDTTGGHAVTLIGCGKSVLSGNTFRKVAKTAILVSDKTSLDAIGNTIVSPGTQGITAQAGAKLAAQSNTISGAKGIGILVDSAAAGSSIVGNTVSATGSHGIRIFKTEGCTVDSNIVTEGQADGIVFDQCRSGTASGNTVTKTVKNAIRLVGTKAIPTTVAVKNNVFSTGRPKKSFDIRLGDYCKKCKLIGNVLSNNLYSFSKKGSSKNVLQPPSTLITKIVRKPKTTVKVWWEKTAGVTGYQIQYAPNSKFKKAKIKTVSSTKAVKATIKKLAKNKKYWFRVRTVQTIRKVDYVSAWSATKRVKP